jgi:hypothetical protein
MAVLRNDGRKKQLDYRSAFRHDAHQAAMTGITYCSRTRHDAARSGRLQAWIDWSDSFGRHFNG